MVWRMPAETEPQARVWMAFPTGDSYLADNQETAAQAWARVAHTIAEFEPVTMVVDPAETETARIHLGEGKIEIIEAPLDDARTLAVIAETKRLIPNKQIKYVVNTHHHWDHAGGLRAAYAEGATIVTNEQNKNFYERVILVPQPRSLSPDRLSMAPFATTGP